MSDMNGKGGTFGAWLLAQSGLEGWAGDLIKAVKTDRPLPRDGRLDDVRERLRDTMAEDDMFETADDARSRSQGTEDGATTKELAIGFVYIGALIALACWAASIAA